jgi:hypothetical protein
MRPPMSKHNINDFQTPGFALNPLLPYLRQEWLIWECSCGKGNLVNKLKEEKYNVIGTDITDGHNFLMWKPERFDCIITNPPYSEKQSFLERAYNLNKPFALLLPLTTFETEKRQNLFDKYYSETKFIFLNKRINFETQSGTGSGAWFSTMWVCYKLELPRILNYYKII